MGGMVREEWEVKLDYPLKKPQGEILAKKKNPVRRKLIIVTFQLMKISTFVVKYKVQKL